MFDISFTELFLVAVVGLLVIGPQRLPEALRTLGLWMGRMRRSFINVKTEIEREIGMDEIRRQLHNEAVMEEMKKIQRDVQHSVSPPAQPDRRPAAASDPAAAGGSVGPTGGTRATADSGVEQLSGAVDSAPVTDGSGHPDAADSAHADAATDRSNTAAEPAHRDAAAPGRTEAAQSTEQPRPAGSDDLRHG